VLQLNICFQRIAQPCNEDINLVLLHQSVAVGEKGEELALEFGHCSLTAELDLFAQGVAAQWWTEALVDEVDEFLP
jgi:hypothetical protein